MYTFMVQSRDALAQVFRSVGLNVTCMTESECHSNVWVQIQSFSQFQSFMSSADDNT